MTEISAGSRTQSHPRVIETFSGSSDKGIDPAVTGSESGLNEGNKKVSPITTKSSLQQQWPLVPPPDLSAANLVLYNEQRLEYTEE